MVGRIREIVFEDGVDVDGIATLAASEDYVDDKFTTQGGLIIDPHGFTEYDNTYMTRSWVGNTFTLTQVGTSTPYFHKGELKYLTGSKSITVTPTAGPHFIGLNCTTEVLEDLGGTIPAASVVSTHVLCEFCYANGTDVIYKANERHSTKFPKRVWFFNHLYLSTQYRTGITPSITSVDGNGSLITHAQYSVTTGIISDEDIDITVAALSAGDSKSLWYYNGTVWVNTAQATGAGVLTAGTGRAAYNDIASGLVECTNNYHVLTHLFAANDGTVIGIVGNAQYQLLNDAKIAASTEIGTLLTTGLPFPEFRAIATFINKTSNSYSNSVKTAILSVDTGVPYIDWRKTSLNPAAGANAANHNQLSSLQGGQAGEYYHLTAADYANIVAKIFPGGAASDTGSKVILPTKAGTAGLTATAGNTVYDSTAKKIKVGDGSVFKEVGGGLATVSLSLSDFTGSPKKYAAENGKHYLVDMASAAEQYTITLPAAETGAILAIQCKNNLNTTYLLAVEKYQAGEEIYYDNAEQSPLYFGYDDMRGDFAWDATDTHWMIAVSQTPLSGTWSGSLDFTGTVKTDTIQEHTTGVGVAIQASSTGALRSSGYVGKPFGNAISLTNGVVYATTTNTTAGSGIGNLLSVCKLASVTPGTYLVVGQCGQQRDAATTANNLIARLYVGGQFATGVGQAVAIPLTAGYYCQVMVTAVVRITTTCDIDIYAAYVGALTGGSDNGNYLSAILIA